MYDFVPTRDTHSHQVELHHEVTLSDGATRVEFDVKRQGSIPTCDVKCRPANSSSLFGSLFRLAVRRGWDGWDDESTEEPDDEEAKPPEHLVLVVHGIGEALWRRKEFTVPSFFDAVNNLRDLSQSLSRKQVSGRFEWLMVYWWEAIQDPVLRQALARSTLPTVPAMRTVANEVILDVLLYMTPMWREKILDTAANALNRTVRKFKKYNPKWNGSVALVGHSLGSVILFDLLSAPTEGGRRLDFSPKQYIALGSPIGCFVSVTGANLRERLATMQGCSFAHIFHPNDPVAYRLEPLLDMDLSSVTARKSASPGGEECGQEDYAVLTVPEGEKRAAEDLNIPPPASLPSARDEANEMFHEKIRRSVVAEYESRKKAMNQAFSVFFQPASAQDQEEKQEKKEEVRLDWQLNVPNTVVSTMDSTVIGGYLSAIPAHTSYFSNDDIVAFIHTRMNNRDNLSFKNIERVESPTRVFLEKRSVFVWQTWSSGVKTFLWQTPANQSQEVYIEQGDVLITPANPEIGPTEATAGMFLTVPPGFAGTWQVRAPLQQRHRFVEAP
jgi:uncharacterized cupin superfamily protein